MPSGCETMTWPEKEKNKRIIETYWENAKTCRRDDRNYPKPLVGRLEGIEYEHLLNPDEKERFDRTGGKWHLGPAEIGRRAHLYLLRLLNGSTGIQDAPIPTEEKTESHDPHYDKMVAENWNGTEGP